MVLDAERRAQLERARGGAIAREHFAVGDDAPIEAVSFGVVVRAPELAVMVSARDQLSMLGGALVWLDRNEVDRAVLVAEHHAHVHARRASVVAPELEVYALDGSSVDRAEPARHADRQPPTGAETTALIAMIERCGATVVTEDGAIRAEVAGLEVGRIVPSPDGLTFEVGVGRFDREAGSLFHAGIDAEKRLADVVSEIASFRRPGAAPHAANRLGRERWLRHVIAGDPGRVDAASLSVIEPIPARSSLLDDVPAALIGTSLDDQRVMVVCTVGIDLGLIPGIADLLLHHEVDEVRVVMPARDHLPIVDRLLQRLSVPASVRHATLPWDEASAPR